jgi:pimeloyl-ACP methyl ester carboxylesterase
MMHVVSRDGTRIAYEVVGDGAPLVLLHGFTESHEIWREVGYVEGLQRSGRRLILIDCRGHGGSGKPHEPREYSALNCADDVVAVLDRLHIARTDVFGHSMGGAIGFALAALHPTRVRGLIVIGAHPLAQDMSSYRNAIDGGIERFTTEHGAEYVELDHLGHVAAFLAVDKVLARVERFVERLDTSEAQ